MSKLNEATIYIGDNGRLFCGALRCAGSTAYASGHDLSGQALDTIRHGDVAQWVEIVGKPPACETCGKTVSP